MTTFTKVLENKSFKSSWTKFVNSRDTDPIKTFTLPKNLKVQEESAGLVEVCLFTFFSSLAQAEKWTKSKQRALTSPVL